MEQNDIRSQRFQRWQAFSGAMLAAMAVALSAYAAHAATGVAQSRLQTAAIFAFGHGVALAALAPQTRGRLACIASFLLRLGLLLFCGSLVANALLDWPTTLAPSGGMLLITGWVVWAVAAVRHH